MKFLTEEKIMIANRLLRIDQAAKILNCSHKTVSRLISGGELMAIKIKSCWRIDECDIAAYITRGKQQYAVDFGYLYDQE